MNKLLLIMLSSSLLMMSCNPTNKKSSTSSPGNQKHSTSLPDNKKSSTSSPGNQKHSTSLPDNKKSSTSPLPYNNHIDIQAASSSSTSDTNLSNSQESVPQIVMDRKDWLERKKEENLSATKFFEKELGRSVSNHGSKSEIQSKLSLFASNLNTITRQLEQIELYITRKSSNTPDDHNSKVEPVDDINYPIFEEEERLSMARGKINSQATLKLKNELESEKEDLIKQQRDLNIQHFLARSLEAKEEIDLKQGWITSRIYSIERELQQIEQHSAFSNK